MDELETVEYWQDRARDILPSATDAEIVEAATLLQAQYEQPHVYPMSEHAYKARQHEQATDTHVTHYGKARVQGFTVPTVEPPNGASGDLLHVMLKDIPRTTVGAPVMDVLKLTDLFYGREIPELLGTDVAAWRQVVHVADGTDPMSCRVAVGQQAAVCKAQTWPTRVRLPAVRQRASEYVPVTTFPAHWDGTECDCPYGQAHPMTRVAVMASADSESHVFIGHQLTPRGKVASKARRAKTEARTIGTVTAESPEALSTYAENLNRGERVVIVVNGVKLSMTRGKSTAGTYSVSRDAKHRKSGLRTPASVASAALSLAS